MDFAYSICAVLLLHAVFRCRSRRHDLRNDGIVLLDQTAETLLEIWPDGYGEETIRGPSGLFSIAERGGGWYNKVSYGIIEYLAEKDNPIEAAKAVTPEKPAKKKSFSMER